MNKQMAMRCIMFLFTINLKTNVFYVKAENHDKPNK